MIDEYSRFPVVEVVRSTSAETVIPAHHLTVKRGKTSLLLAAWNSIVAPGQRPSGKLQQANDESNPGSSRTRRQLDKCFASISACVQVHTTQHHNLHTVLPPIWARAANTWNYWKLPEIGFSAYPDDKLVRHQDSLAKSSMKHRFDQRTHAQKSSLQVGDIVLVRQRKANKLSTPFDPHPLVLADKKGSMVTAKRNGEATVTRNVSMFHRLPHASHTQPILPDLQEDVIVLTQLNRREKPDDVTKSVPERPSE